MTSLSSLRLSVSLMWRAAQTAITMTLLWWILTDNAGWSFGVVAIFAATLVTLVFPPAAARWNLVGLLRFLMYFCKESLLAGIQVVRLAFKANLELRPVVVVYSLRVPSGPARTLFVMMISLLPGTLSAGLDGDKVIVHILSAELNGGLAFLEERVAGLYGISL